MVTDTRYHGEGIGNAILEYIGLEKPVIATFLIPFGDENAVASRIREIAECPDFGSALGRAGRVLVEQKFGIEQMVQKHVELFRQLASGNRALSIEV